LLLTKLQQNGQPFRSQRTLFAQKSSLSFWKMQDIHTLAAKPRLCRDMSHFPPSRMTQSDEILSSTAFFIGLFSI